jgi:hypothetical protein
MMVLEKNLRTEFSVRIADMKRTGHRLASWAQQPDTRGQFCPHIHVPLQEVSPPGISDDPRVIVTPPSVGTLYFTDEDTALTCLLLFGDIPQTSESQKFRYPVLYTGPMDVDTIGELRDWLNDLPASSWLVETERFISPKDFNMANHVIVRFATPEEAFSFKMRWHAPT